MDRGIWLFAAWMVNQFGTEAPTVVERRLELMEREQATQGHKLIWCHIGHAVLEIVKSRPDAGETFH